MDEALRQYFSALGKVGGKQGSKNLTRAQRTKRAKQAGIASGKARRKRARAKRSRAA